MMLIASLQAVEGEQYKNNSVPKNWKSNSELFTKTNTWGLGEESVAIKNKDSKLINDEANQLRLVLI